ncbi:cytochrome b/b6 domain-containing protein [Tropicimonas isoalkanivorans]|uniref:Cytochrome b n=1 Tax=Tropicimonas isoalkanivorans TaxID=441112 RepID=A0A1I1DR66_9RHOB|nr:cytochrome b/b6 domain-containing protein [Tropicimonas isoalkanivorans]SFB75528.1 Cytochrome b [Tropicimonas isoalkanivorans]
MTRLKVWDPFVRLFHWSLVTLFAANALFVDDDGKLHQWIGYAILALVLARILWGIVGPGYARFSTFPPSLSAATGQVRDIALGRTPLHTGHTPLGAFMIYNLILTLLVICTSGYLMTTDMFWGVEWPEVLHEAAVTWAEISVLLHIAAVIFESRRTRINLPFAMVTGYKEIPSEQD